MMMFAPWPLLRHSSQKFAGSLHVLFKYSKRRFSIQNFWHNPLALMSE